MIMRAQIGARFQRHPARRAPGQVRARAKGTPFTRDQHRARAIELGVNEYLGTPYQEGQLLQAIEPLVRKAAS